MKPPLDRIPPGLRSLHDYERLAQAHLPSEIWLHIQEGAGRQITLAENLAAFDRIGLLPRAMCDLAGDTSVDLFGRRHAAPIMLAPLAYQKIAHPDGELATVRGATASGTGMIVSTLSSVPLEDIAAAAASAADELSLPRVPLWFQLYLQPDREASLRLVRRAEAAGYEAIVLTIDAALKPAGITLPKGITAVNLDGLERMVQTSTPGGRLLLGTALAEAAPTWQDLAWLRAATELPLIVKGMVLGEDAQRAVDAGANGLIVSNHGGRVLDGLPSALEVIQSIARATSNRVPLLLDGGVRMGTDVVKALALGASSVLIGRPQMHAIAVAGVAGVAHAIHLLRVELEAAMAQLGCPRCNLLTSDRLVALAR